jgi:hypothetical protein
MNITGFLQCLGASGINTGNLLSFYDFNVKNTGIVFNLKYPTGSGYYQNIINNDSYPGIIVGSGLTVGSQKSTLVKLLSGYSSFSCLIDFDFSGCQNTGLAESTVLLTSKTNPNQVSGFSFGINSANRLFVENNQVIYTLNRELKDKNLLAFNIASGASIDFGVLDFDNNSYANQTLNISELSAFTDLYLINFLSGANNKYSGAMGTVQNFALFTESINDSRTLLNCSICSGTVSSANQTDLITTTLTGLLTGGLYSNQVTGYQLASGTYINEQKQTGYFYYLSGRTGAVLYDYEYTNLFSTGTVTISYGTNTIPLLSSGDFFNYNKFNILLDQQASGDYFEVYTYNSYQPYRNTRIGSTFLTPIPGYYLNLYINGVLESQGYDYDLSVGDQIVALRDSIIVNDSLFVSSYEVSPTVTLNYSNLVFSSPNYIATGSGSLIPTGNYEIYLNGLKVIKNSGYQTGTYSSNFAILINSGINPLFTDDEIKIYPAFNESTYRVTGLSTLTNMLSGFSGVSEMVWRNGQLLRLGVGYTKYQNCSLDSDYFLSSQSNFLIYNNDGYYLNI